MSRSPGARTRSGSTALPNTTSMPTPSRSQTRPSSPDAAAARILSNPSSGVATVDTLPTRDGPPGDGPRGHAMWLSDAGGAPPAQRLARTVGRGAPRPLEGAVAVPPQPRGRPPQLQRPDPEDPHGDHRAGQVDVGEQPPEHDEAEDGLGEVVGEGHPAGVAEAFEVTTAAAVEHDEDGEVAQRHRDRAHAGGDVPDDRDVG